VAKLRRFLKQLELVDSFKKSLSGAPIVSKMRVASPKNAEEKSELFRESVLRETLFRNGRQAT
ncbi:MAG: hypothetical protein II748_08160, partial [Clostridia bacterium]|nr:hypothetical protein [Clostridia bacterium]